MGRQLMSNHLNGDNVIVLIYLDKWNSHKRAETNFHPIYQPIDSIRTCKRRQHVHRWSYT